MLERSIVAVKKGLKISLQIIKSKKPSLVYAAGVHSQLDNLGDHALFLSYKELFKDFSVIEYPLSGGRVAYYPVKLLKPTKISILAGGTLINRISPRPVKKSLDATGNLIIFGTGVAQNYFWKNIGSRIDYTSEWADLLHLCKYIGVRGPLSQKQLIEMGVTNSKVVGDPVISYSLTDQYNPADWISKTIGLNIGQSHGQIWGSEESLLKEYIKLASILKKNGWKVKWYVVWPEDSKITEFAAKESGTEKSVLHYYHDPKQYIDEIKNLNFFVGCKLHAVVLATCAYVPSIMIEYRPKCLDYMMSIRHAEWNIRGDKMKADDLWNIIDSLKDNRVVLSENLCADISRLRVTQNCELSKVKDIINEIN